MALSDPRVAAATRHREVSGHFAELAESVTDWDAPAPVPGWTAREVVRHLVEWSAGFLAGGAAVELATGPSPDDDPAAAWRTHHDAVQGLLDDPATAERVLDNPHVGRVPLPEAIDRFYTTDVFMHTWDLARAGGLDPGLDPDACAAMLAGIEPMDEVLRSSGQYGPAVPVSPDAGPVDRLMAFIGRDPAWTPSG